MAELSKLRETVKKEALAIHRGLVLLAGMASGAGLFLALLRQFNLGTVSTAEGIAGPVSMGMMAAWQRLDTVLLLVGALAGALLAQWIWTMLGQVQKMLSSLGSETALKRAAIPFAVFLPQITALSKNTPDLAAPWISFALLAAGVLLLALCEKKDKRKIFFAHPTESDYSPISFFIHGSVIALGTGVGWFLQSLPTVAPATPPGLWFPLDVGILIWILTLLIGTVLGLFFSKQTFDQVYTAVGLAVLPLAVLPLQTLGWIDFIQDGKVVNHMAATWLPATLLGLAGLGFVVILVFGVLHIRRQPVEATPSGEELFRALMLILGVPFLLFSVAYNPQGAAFQNQSLVGDMDLFRDGEGLGVAQAILSGKLPFKEILLRHGFLTDAVSGLTAIQWFGPSAASWRMLMVFLAPLGLVAVYLLAIFCLPWLWALLLTVVLLTGHLGSVPMTRFFFPVVGFIFTLYYIQRGRWPILIFSGFLTALSLIASHTAGMVALCGILVLMTAYVLFGQNTLKIRLIHLGIYLASAIGFMLPWWLYLGMSGSLGAYFENITWVMNQYASVYGLPLRDWMAQPTIGQMLIFAMPPLMIVIGLLILLQAVRDIRQTGFLPWNVLVLVVLSGMLWLRFLNRSDFSFLRDVIPFAAMLLAFFLYRLTAKHRLMRGLVFALLLPLVFLPQSGFLSLPELAGAFGGKNRIDVSGYRASTAERLEKCYLPESRTASLEAVMQYLDGQVGTTETYYDFSNQPLVYFLVPRKPVVKTLCTSTSATFDQQLETVRRIANADVKAVLFQGDRLPEMALDGIPSVVRQYAVSEYLLNAFAPSSVVADWVTLTPPIGGIEPDPKAIASLKRPVELQALPKHWGTMSKYDPGQGGLAGRYAALGGTQAVEAGGTTVTVMDGKIQVAGRNGLVRMKLTLEGDPVHANVLVLELKADAALDGQPAVLTWGNDKSQRLSFRIFGNGRLQRYAFRVAALPAWVYADNIKTLSLEMPGGGWTWERTVLLQVRDIPELAAAAKKETK